MARNVYLIFPHNFWSKYFHSNTYIASYTQDDAKNTTQVFM
jgi:hypothetical protein